MPTRIRAWASDLARRARQDQLQLFQARMAGLADDDVVVHQNAQGLGDLHDRLRHRDVRAARCRIAARMIVHEAPAAAIGLSALWILESRQQLETSTGDCKP